jgi:hypothetical protein
MADRYWVGGTGNWSDTARWSATSGGAGGASVPGSGDAAIFNSSSGAGTATVDSDVTIQTLTTNGFTGTLAFGTKTISLNGSGANIFVGATTYAVTGTPIINIIYSGSDATTIYTDTPTAANAISFNINAGTYQLSMDTFRVKNLNFTGFSGSFLSLSSCGVYGNLTISTGMTYTSGTGTVSFLATSGTNTITTNGKTIPTGISFNGAGGTFQLQDALTINSTSQLSLIAGTLDLNGKTVTCGNASISNTGVRTLAFNGGNITCIGAGGTLWTASVTTNLTVTGASIVNISYSGATATTIVAGVLTEANSISFNFTAGTYLLTFLGSGVLNHSARNVNFTGFSGTWNSTGTNKIYGGLTLSSAMTLSTGSGVLTFAATSGTQVLTSNGKTINISLNFDGVGGTWQLSDALLMGASGPLTHTNGTINLNGKTLTAGADYTTATGTKNLTFNGGTLVCPTAATTAFNNAVPTGYTTTAGTGTGKIA